MFGRSYHFGFVFFFSSRRRHTRFDCDWSSDVCSSDLDVTDAFSRQFSSYFVEDGSYVRLRSIQVGYDFPPAFVRWIPAARIYLRAENLFTITGYSGPDPALPAWDVEDAG